MTTQQTILPAIDFALIGPAVGTPFPDVVLPDQHGQLVDLHAARAGRRALVVFHRSADWCPFCRTQLVELQRSYHDFEQQDIALFAISYDSVAVLAAFSERYGIAYPLLSDEGSAAIRALGLFNEHVFEHHAVYGVAPQERHLGTPYPGVFVLDADGVVTEKRFQQSYRERETGAGILEDAFHIESSIHPAPVPFASDGVAGRAWLDSDTYRYFQRLHLTVELTIERGLHVYGLPIPEGYIPLSVEVAPFEGVEVGTLQLPDPKPFQIDGLDEQFLVYEGRVAGTMTVTFTKRDAGDLVLQITVRYQACSADDCLLPVSASFELPVTAAALVPSATPAER